MTPRAEPPHIEPNFQTPTPNSADAPRVAHSKIGVASTVQSAGLVTLVSAADAALHQAKRGGRDRVITSPGSPTAVPNG